MQENRNQNSRDRSQSDNQNISEKQHNNLKDSRRNVSRPRPDKLDDINSSDYLRESPDLYERGAE